MAICPVCDEGETGDVSDVSRRQAASVNVPPELTSVDLMQTIAAWAEGLARSLLADTLPPLVPRPGRRRPGPHPRAVPRRRRRPDRSRRVAARHGHLPELAQTGLHGLDGARYLRDIQHAEPLLCRLVAHHSCAVIEAEERGLAHVLTREFTPPPSRSPTR